MKKKITALFALTCAMLTLASCGGKGEGETTSADDDVSESITQDDSTTSEDTTSDESLSGEFGTTPTAEETSKPAETTAVQPTQAPTQTPTPTQAPTNAPANTSGSFSASDVYCVIKGATLKLDTAWSNYSSALGTPSSTEEAPSCHFDNMDVIYHYSGFSIYTYIKDGVSYVYDIEITSSSIKTPKGIAVGSSAADVIAAYGDKYTSKTEALIEYTSGNKSLYFSMSGGKVSMIEFFSE